MADLFLALSDWISHHWEYMIASIFLASVAVQLFYYLFFYLRVACDRPKADSGGRPKGLSVVICARDEQANLRANLPGVVAQDHPDLDILVVLDACADDSLAEVAAQARATSRLRFTVIERDGKFTHGKKLALTVGIKGALHDRLLLTDADCRPATPRWASLMSSRLEGGTELVLGYGKYAAAPGLVNRLIRYDTFFIGQQYLSFAKAGIPYMGVGRNLAYTRPLHSRVGGFASHASLPSGDDDLFVNAAARGRNYAVELRPDAHTTSAPPATYALWRKQKSRHLLAAAHYPRPRRALLGLEPLTRWIVWLGPAALPIMPAWTWWIAGGAALRFVVFMLVVKLNMRKLDEKGFWLLAPFFDIFLPLFVVSLYARAALAPRRPRLG